MNEDKQNIEQSEPFGAEHHINQFDQFEPFEQVEHIEQAAHIEYGEHIEETEHIEQAAHVEYGEQVEPAAHIEHDVEHINEELVPVASTEQDSDLGNEHDLEDMDSNLNPGKFKFGHSISLKCSFYQYVCG